MPGHKRHLAYIPEQVHLYPHLSGAENLERFAGLGGSAVSGASSLERAQPATRPSARRC